MRKKGISLIVLVITIIVIIIIAGAVILTMSNGGILDQAKKARFMSDFTNIQEGVNLYSLGKYNESTTKFELPLKGYLTSGDKLYIKDNVPTLSTKIEELSGNFDDVNLGWIDNEEINANLSTEKKTKGYIIDVNNGQLYDYNGDYFEGKRWHTLDGGVVENGTPTNEIAEELWDGWIRLTLYYPSNSTARQWRLGSEGELRADPMLMWQDYTGSINIPLDRMKDVWIKYMLNNKEVIIPPAGTLLVDISPDKTGDTKVSVVNVKINYDETATTKEYRIGDSGWITYTEPFKVTENCIIEARAKKTETIYNVDGSLLTTRNIAGKDLVYIGNIGIEESDLEAPTIARLPAVGDEKARVQVTYPENAVRKIYKINYGVEQNYTSEINVTSYGTYIIAYYYDSTGKRSRASTIRINDTTTVPAEPSGTYNPKPPYKSGDPKPVYVPDSIIPAPTINVSPTSITEEVQVSIDSPGNADTVYIKLGKYAAYEEYTSPVAIRQNMEVYAYYRTNEGEKSDTANRKISNIKKNNKPYVYINANPYPWNGSYGEDKVTVTIEYSDANTIEYSEDGIVYQTYTAPFEVTENKTIYARGVNAYGVTEETLNITNIGKLTSLPSMKNIAININVNPEPKLSTNRVDKTYVTIDYDSNATEKYYSIGKYGTVKTYTGTFEVTSNCTIYAYAKGVNAKGQKSKTIDNLITGVSEPIISSSPSSKEQASKVNISIEYDKYAKIKRYSIDGGTLRDYSETFEITKNGTTIYAYSENELGQKSESNYTIENIVPEPPSLVLDKGDYYLLKLNFPEGSKVREYKWKENGEWKEYKEAGILLIKPQFKDKLIQNGVLVKIEDENGKLITFTGDYYLIDVAISELFENVFMRWDRVTPATPQIILNTTEPAKVVTATILYDSSLIKKQYKIVKPGEVSSSWQDYTGPITIDKNNTTIYARGMDDAEMWSSDGMYKVINIDETQPVIKLTADLDTAQQKVSVKVNVTDDVAVGVVKWVAGIQGENYFTSSGTEITNNSIVNITSNGYYTFYAEDRVGNKQVYTLNVTNVDLTPPAIDIQVSPENTVGLTSNVTINYGDSTIKQYKVGTSSSTWSTYTTSFAISSYTILTNNLKNDDGTVTIYAKGKDTAGNEITVQKKVVSLDLDIPNSPVITSNIGYAKLTSYGIILDSVTSISYDNRTDINNYYSIDNGVNWIPYTAPLNIASGTVIAKSVKKESGLEVTVSRTITMPADAMKQAAYDSNDTTYVGGVTSQYIQVDDEMQLKNIRIKIYRGTGTLYIRFLDVNKQIISSQSWATTATFDNVFTVPAGTKWIRYDESAVNVANKLYEIQSSDEPTFAGTNDYMFVTDNASKAIRQPYQMVKINYFVTSVQRLYRIGTTGNWLSYNEQTIKVNQGETLYAKGIDSKGKETRIVSSYTANSTDALGKEAYDINDTTYSSLNNSYIKVDSSMYGKAIQVYWKQNTNNATMNVQFLDANKNIIANNSQTTTVRTYTNVYKVPDNSVYVKFITTGSFYIYEVKAVTNYTDFSSTYTSQLISSVTGNQYVKVTNTDSYSIGKWILIYCMYGINDAGKYEFAYIDAIDKVNNTIILRDQLTKFSTYSNVYAVNVMQSEWDLVIGKDDIIKSSPWNGTQGGIVAIRAKNVTLNGKIDVSASGYRGGPYFSGVNNRNGNSGETINGGYNSGKTSGYGRGVGGSSGVNDGWSIGGSGGRRS